MSMSTVCANSMTSHDFDGNFKMDVPKDSNFVKQAMEDNKDADVLQLDSGTYLDEKNLILVEFVDSPLISDSNDKVLYHYVFSEANGDLNQSYEYQEDNLRVIVPVKNTDEYISVVGFNEGNKTVCLMGYDVDLLKDMAHTVEF